MLVPAQRGTQQVIHGSIEPKVMMTRSHQCLLQTTQKEQHPVSVHTGMITFTHVESSKIDSLFFNTAHVRLTVAFAGTATGALCASLVA